ncbi:MAG: MazG nucleotide pyrophosphohydrolase domain-containing protein [Vulcanimicrobiota bacterium]
MELPNIPSNATLGEWQSYIGELVKARGWDRADDLEIFLLLTEEVGELAKAYRRHRALFVEGHPGDEKTTHRELAGELADVLSYLLDLSQRLGVDLEQALVEKEQHNRGREWS